MKVSLQTDTMYNKPTYNILCLFCEDYNLWVSFYRLDGFGYFHAIPTSSEIKL